MTQEEAESWIESNLPTTDRRGKQCVYVTHDTDGTTDCSICGRPHDPTTEYHTVKSLTDQYHEEISSELPNDASSVADAAAKAAASKGQGHERFFEQIQ